MAQQLCGVGPEFWHWDSMSPCLRGQPSAAILLVQCPLIINMRILLHLSQAVWADQMLDH